MCTPEAITVAVTLAPGTVIGAPPSIWIAVNGPLALPLTAIPEAESLAVAVSFTGSLDQPRGSPSIRVSGSVLSTRRIVVPTGAEGMPEPETATACT